MGWTRVGMEARKVGGATREGCVFPVDDGKKWRRNALSRAGNVALPRGITSGPGTDVWFASTNSDRIGRIATTGPEPGPPPAPPEPVVVAPRFTG